MPTVLVGAHESDVSQRAGDAGDGDRLWIPLVDLEPATGWTAKPEGLCRGDVCIPIPPAKKGEWLDASGQRLDFAAFAAHLGHALAREGSVWSFGPPAGPDGAGAGSIDAPDFRLPDLDGRLHSLSDYRGKKVLLYCWASW